MKARPCCSDGVEVIRWIRENRPESDPRVVRATPFQGRFSSSLITANAEPQEGENISATHLEAPGHFSGLWITNSSCYQSAPNALWPLEPEGTKSFYQWYFGGVGWSVCDEDTSAACGTTLWPKLIPATIISERKAPAEDEVRGPWLHPGLWVSPIQMSPCSFLPSTPLAKGLRMWLQYSCYRAYLGLILNPPSLGHHPALPPMDGGGPQGPSFLSRRCVGLRCP